MKAQIPIRVLGKIIRQRIAKDFVYNDLRRIIARAFSALSYYRQ